MLKNDHLAKAAVYQQQDRAAESQQEVQQAMAEGADGLAQVFLLFGATSCCIGLISIFSLGWFIYGIVMFCHSPLACQKEPFFKYYIYLMIASCVQSTITSVIQKAVKKEAAARESAVVATNYQPLM